MAVLGSSGVAYGVFGRNMLHVKGDANGMEKCSVCALRYECAGKHQFDCEIRNYQYYVPDAKAIADVENEIQECKGSRNANDEYTLRPCVVLDKKCTFHTWAKMLDWVKAPPHFDPLKAIQILVTRAIVEYEDGTVGCVPPEFVKFTDRSESEKEK